MNNKSSGHVKPCKIGQSEAHNKRAPEYLARINEKDLYIRCDLTPFNSTWVAAEAEQGLQSYQDGLAKMVKEKTGRAMQTGERERVDKKTGKKKKVNGSSPIREEVVNCKPDTTMDDLKEYARKCQVRWGITALQIYLHRDEGHCDAPGDISTWVPNLHAHIVWDWMDHATGKSWKLTPQDMSAMQDLLAETLQMERGKRKAETGAEHLERNDYIIAKQKQEILSNDEKLHKDRRNCLNNILKGTSDLLTGKLYRLEKENKSLKEAYPLEINHAREEAEVEYTLKLQAAEKRYKAALSEMNARLGRSMAENHTLSQRLESLNRDCKAMQARIDFRNRMIRVLSQWLYQVSELFRKAVRVIVNFVQDEYRSFLTADEAIIVKTVMDTQEATGMNRKDVGECLVCCADSLSEFDNAGRHKADREVEDVANGNYDGKLERYGMRR